MSIRAASMLACVTGLCMVAAATAATAAQTPTTARAWLAALPPLPATTEEAYGQWTDLGGTLNPSPASQRIAESLKAEILALERPALSAATSGKTVSAHDQALLEQISEFQGTASLQRNIQAARTARSELEQKWHAELSALELRRQQERTALPACRNEAGAPSQLAIRDVERRYAEQKTAIATRYLALFRPLVEQMKAAVMPRIEHGDAALAAWTRLRNPALKAELEPLAQGAESNALADVGLVQAYIEDLSRMAARPVADRKALERVYAQAKGC